jgi:DNA-binding transcriptional LysR family regulator
VGKRLGDLTMMNLASPAYLQKHGVPRTIADLDEHLLVNYSLTLGAEPATFEYWDGSGYSERPMRSQITVNTADAYQSACLAGMGIIQTPRWGTLPRPDLVEILPEHPCAPMPVSLVHAHGRNVPKRVRAVMNWIEELIVPRLAQKAAAR